MSIATRLTLAGALWLASGALSPLMAQSSIGDRSGRVEWNGWALDYSTFDYNDGLALTGVSYEGVEFINRISFPVMSVYYDGNCGPYADRLNGPQAPVTWAGDAPLVAREFTQNGRRWLELGIREFIGSYDIYQAYYFSADGSLNPRVFSRGLQCSYFHEHYPMWRIDFDIDGYANDRILRQRTDGTLTPMTDEFQTAASDAFDHGWYVEDTVTGTRARVGFDNGGFDVDTAVIPADDYEVNRVGGMGYASSELGWSGGPSRDFPYVSSTTSIGDDVVLWYRGYLPHSPEEGASLWHSTGLAISLGDDDATGGGGTGGGTGGGVACGDPGVDPATDFGLHVWKECGGNWQVMLTGGNTVAGRLGDGGTIADLQRASVESADRLVVGDDAIDFRLSTGTPWNDRFSFSTADDDNLCLAIDSLSSGARAYLGPDRVPVSGSFRPATGEACSLGAACTAPTIDASGERALFAWVCDSRLNVVATGGSGSARYTGRVHAGGRFTNLASSTVEASDRLEAPDAETVAFDLGTGGGAIDSFAVNASDPSSLCVAIDSRSAGTELLAGSERTPVGEPFNPVTFAGCTAPSTGCGTLVVDAAAESGLFVWKSCDGLWHVLATGNGTQGAGARYTGTVDAPAGVGGASDVSLESSDTLTRSSATRLDFSVTTSTPWQDEFTFAADAAQGLCVTIASMPAGVGRYVGVERTAVGLAFDAVTGGACR